MFQTRNEEGDIKHFQTMEEAFTEAKKDKTVWKISTKGVRLIRQFERNLEFWLHRPIEDYITNIPRPSKGEIQGLDY